MPKSLIFMAWNHESTRIFFLGKVTSTRLNPHEKVMAWGWFMTWRLEMETALGFACGNTMKYLCQPIESVVLHLWDTMSIYTYIYTHVT